MSTEPRVLSKIDVCCACGRLYAAGGFKTLSFGTTVNPPEWVVDQYAPDEDDGAWIVYAPEHPCECGCNWFERATTKNPSEQEPPSDNHPGWVGEDV